MKAQKEKRQRNGGERTLHNRPRRITPLPKTRQELVKHDPTPEFLVEQVTFIQEEDDHDLFRAHTIQNEGSVMVICCSATVISAGGKSGEERRARKGGGGKDKGRAGGVRTSLKSLLPTIAVQSANES